MKDKEILTTEETKSVSPQQSEQQPKPEQETITPLMQAASRNNIETILDLLNKGKSLEEKSLIESTAVMFAAQIGHLKATQLLLERGADAKHRNKYNWNTFLYAVYGKNPELVEWMIKNNYVVLNEFDVNTAFLVAAMNGNLAMLLLLFKYGKEFIKDRQTILGMENPYHKKDISLITSYFDMVRDIFAIENNSIEALDLQHDRDENIKIFSSYLKNNLSIKKLSYRCVNTESVQHIEKFFENNPVIEELSFREDSFGANSFWNYYQLEGRHFDRIFAALNNNPNLKLRKLDLSYNKSMNKQEVQALANLITRNPSLKELNLDSCKLNPEQTKIITEVLLKNNIQLEKLNLSSNKIGVDGAKSVTDLLLKNNHLKYLSLSCNQDMGEGLFALFKVLGQNNCLEELDLSTTYPGKRDVEAIQKMLIKNKTLKKLDLAHNYFDSADGICIIDGLSQNNSVENIDLGQSCPSKSFDAETGKSICNLFKNNKTLKKIVLDNNDKFSITGFQYISDGLKENNTLEYLGLYNVDINDESLNAILSAIKKNQTLKHLKLGCNKITDIGAKGIAELLQGNSVPLQCLSLYRNDIKTKGYSQIFEALKKNNKLKTLYVGYDSYFTSVDQEATEVLLDTLRYFNLTIKDITGFKGDDILITNIENLLLRNQKLANKDTSPTEVEEILKNFRSDRRNANLSENPHRFRFEKELQVLDLDDNNSKKSEFSMK